MNVQFVSLPRNDFLQVAADHFASQANTMFSASPQIEYLRLRDYEATNIGAASIFTEMEELLKARGLIPDGTFGKLSRLAGLTQYDAHVIGCACEGQEVSGQEVARRINSLIGN